MEPTATTTAPSDVLTRRSPRRFTRVRFRLLIVPAVVLVGVGVLGGVAMEVRHQTQATDAQLAAVRAQLRQAERSLNRARTILAGTVAHSKVVQQSLTSATAQLETVQGQLSKAEVSQFVSGVNISAAQACLGGVRVALNELALGNGAAAVASLNPVAQSCQTALDG